MKILYFTRSQTPHDLRFTRALSASGHSTAVLCLEETPGREWPKGIQVLSWPQRPTRFSWVTAPMLARMFAKVVEDYHPDVVHAGPIQQAAFIAALAGVSPLLSMSWGSDLLKDAEFGPIWRCITRYTLQRTTLLAADCQTVVNAARKYGFTRPVSIFPWGVDLDHFKPGGMGDLRKKLGWQKTVVFLSSRTLEKIYGVDVIARAFAAAVKKNDNLRLLLFGKGSQELAVYKILNDAGAANFVHLGGFADLQELPDIYHSADVYVSASHSDGSSVSLMEALACGKPVILSDIPSNREWIETGKQGWFFTDGDADDLEARMLGAAQNTNLDEMSSAARKLAEARADWKKNFAILLTAYDEAVRIGKDQS